MLTIVRDVGVAWDDAGASSVRLVLKGFGEAIAKTFHRGLFEGETAIADLFHRQPCFGPIKTAHLIHLSRFYRAVGRGSTASLCRICGRTQAAHKKSRTSEEVRPGTHFVKSLPTGLGSTRKANNRAAGPGDGLPTEADGLEAASIARRSGRRGRGSRGGRSGRSRSHSSLATRRSARRSASLGFAAARRAAVRLATARRCTARLTAAAMAAAAAGMTATTATTAITATTTARVTSLHLGALTAQEGDADEREEDRDAKDQCTIHFKLLKNRYRTKRNSNTAVPKSPFALTANAKGKPIGRPHPPSLRIYAAL